MKKTEEELDKLHEITMSNLYEVFEDEMDSFFKFKEAAIGVLGWGNGTFPFSTRYDCAMDHIDKSLEVIEKNIFQHILDNMEPIFEKKQKKPMACNQYSENLKREFSDKLKLEIHKKLFKG